MNVGEAICYAGKQEPLVLITRVIPNSVQPGRYINYQLAPGEILIQCPYAISHTIRTSRMGRHIFKCRKNYARRQRMRGGGEVMSLQCKYSPAHWIPSPELQYHENQCSERNTTDEIRSKIRTCAPQCKVAEDELLGEIGGEEWNDEDGVTYDPAKHLRRLMIIQQPSGLTKTEKKQFRIYKEKTLRQWKSEIRLQMSCQGKNVDAGTETVIALADSSIDTNKESEIAESSKEPAKLDPTSVVDMSVAEVENLGPSALDVGATPYVSGAADHGVSTEDITETAGLDSEVETYAPIMDCAENNKREFWEREGDENENRVIGDDVAVVRQGVSMDLLRCLDEDIEHGQHLKSFKAPGFTSRLTLPEAFLDDFENILNRLAAYRF